MIKDWTEICEKYKGLWVALADDEQTVIASGKDVSSTIALSAEKGNDNPILFRVPDEIVDFVGHEDSVQAC